MSNFYNFLIKDCSVIQVANYQGGENINGKRRINKKYNNNSKKYGMKNGTKWGYLPLQN